VNKKEKKKGRVSLLCEEDKRNTCAKTILSLYPCNHVIDMMIFIRLHIHELRN